MLSIRSCTSTGNLPSSTWSSSACWISTRENPIFTNMLCNTAIAVMTRIAVARLTVNGQHAIRMSRSKSHSLHTFTAMHGLCNNTFNTAKFVHFTYNINTSLYLQYEPNLWFQSHLLFLKEIMHFHDITYMATPQHKKTLARGSWNLQLS